MDTLNKKDTAIPRTGYRTCTCTSYMYMYLGGCGLGRGLDGTEGRRDVALQLLLQLLLF